MEIEVAGPSLKGTVLASSVMPAPCEHSGARILGAVLVLLAACSGPPEVAPFTNDPQSKHQGYMPAIGVPAAWKLERGDPRVIVAVIDGSFDTAQEDLAQQLWTNPAEVAGDGVDNDRDGLVDDVHGWNFLTGSPSVALGEQGDLDRGIWAHGTAVAGIIAAQTDNGRGVAGCCPGCRLMLLTARDFQSVNTVVGVPRFVDALAFAVSHGARVVNVSDGVPASSLGSDDLSKLEDAVHAADAAGVLVVASAGNDAADAVRVPARLDTVLAVAAVDWNGVPASFTSFGSEVDIAAPGVDVFTTFPDNSYDWFDGTSASAPVVAGLAGLLFSEHPDWTARQVADRITSTARPANLDGRPELVGRFGAGVVDFAAALAPGP